MPKLRYNVGIIFDEEVARRVTEVHQVSDRLIMVKVSATPVDMAIIQVYMPTTANEDENIEQIYKQIENIISKQKGNTNAIVTGDCSTDSDIDKKMQERTVTGFSFREEIKTGEGLL